MLYNQTGKASIRITSERNDEYNKNEEKNVFASLFVVRVFFFIHICFILYRLSGTGMCSHEIERI